MRKPIIIANWKMYKTKAEAQEFCHQLKTLTNGNIPETAICAPYTLLDTLRESLADTDILLGAQNFYPQEEGAFTGEISVKMLKDVGVQLVLIGHSERRMLFGEDDELIQRKLLWAYEHQLQPVLCLGETLAQREQNISETVCLAQFAHAVDNLSNEQIGRLIVAYEPIWAIGSGKTATAADAQAMIGAIRTFVKERYDHTAAMTMRVLYGGSVKPENIAELLAQQDIDGALVGGASLAAESFAQLLKGAIT